MSSDGGFFMSFTERITPVKSQVETITPARAQNLLEYNTQNRRLRRFWVERLADYIRNNKWKVTHQGIAIDKNGNVLDGQHRLHAIVLAGIPVKCMVTQDMDPQTMTGIDQGINRNVADIAGPLGYGINITSFQTAVARQMYVAMRPTSEGFTSKEDHLLFLMDHLDAINFAISVLHKKGFLHASMRAVIARAWYTQDHDRLREFGEVLGSGETRGIGDNGAIRLRDYYTKHITMFNGAQARAVLYCKTESALVAFLEHRSMSRLQACEAEKFPLPKEEFDGDSSTLQSVSGDDSGRDIIVGERHSPSRIIGTNRHPRRNGPRRQTQI